MAPGRRARAALVGQLLLALAALFSLPLGARDGGGVSSILPPLRTTVPGVDALAMAGDARRDGDDVEDAAAPAADRVVERWRRHLHPERRRSAPRPSASSRLPRWRCARRPPGRAPPLVG